MPFFQSGWNDQFFLVHQIRVATLNLPISNRRSAFISISVHQVSENENSQDAPASEWASSMIGEKIDYECNSKRESGCKMKLVTSLSSCTMINKQQLCLFQVWIMLTIKKMQKLIFMGKWRERCKNFIPSWSANL